MINRLRAFLALFKLCGLLNSSLAVVLVSSTDTLILSVKNQWLLPPDASLKKTEITAEQIRCKEVDLSSCH